MHAALALLAVLQAAPPSGGDTARVVLVATTDVHGRVLAWDYVRDQPSPGGLARAATVVDSLRARHPAAVVLLDAGDLIQGNPFAAHFATEDRRRPHPVIEALNALQYDAATPGNHEFDYGVETLERAAADAAFRYVSGNVERASGGALFPQTALLQRGPVRIGVTGFTTPGVMVWDRAQLAGRLRVRPIGDAAPAALRALEQLGADLRVVLVHSGLGGPSSYDTTGVGPENVAAGLAALEPRPHVVVVGHSHRELRDSVINGVHFVQPRNWARSLAVVHVGLVRDGARHRVATVRAEAVPLDAAPEQPRFVRRFADAHERVRNWAATPVGTAGPGFDGRLGRAQDVALLDFVNEVQRRRTGADLAATALFDREAALPEGEIRLRDLWGVYPYENTLRAVRISGLQLKTLLEHSSRYYHTLAPGRPIVNDSVPGYDFDVISGLRYSLDLTRPVGQRVRMTWQGRAVSASDSFTLALNSYRQEGGGGYAMLRGAPVVYDRGESVRDLLIAEIRRVGALRASDYHQVNWGLVPAEALAAARAAFGAALAAPAAPAARAAARGAERTVIRVLAVTDLHGALTPRPWDWSDGRPVGGVVALDAWMDSLARSCLCEGVLRLDAGDQMQGTLASNIQFGRPVVAALNAMEFDAAAIGNHEFDWSVDTLRARMLQARYRFLSANITDAAGTARPAWAEPFVVIRRGSARVAVIGLTTETTPTATAPPNVRGLAFGDLAEAVRRVLPDARRQADYVVVVAHAGGQCDAGGCSGEIIELARGLDSAAVDLIVAGHTHRVVNTVVNGIPVVQAGSSGSAIAVADFTRDDGRRGVRTLTVTPWADRTPARDVRLAQLVQAAERSADTIAARPVARFRLALERDGWEYGLGRLIADAQRTIARADVAIMNNGGIRAGLPAGVVTYGDLYRVQPFQNRLLRLRVPGAALLEALEHAVSGAQPDAHVAGVEVWYDPQRPAGRRVTRTRLGTGRAIEPGETYTLAVTDFLASGGSGFAMLQGPPREDLGMVEVDALVQYLRVLREPIEAPSDQRIHGR